MTETIDCGENDCDTSSLAVPQDNGSNKINIALVTSGAVVAVLGLIVIFFSERRRWKRRRAMEPIYPDDFSDGFSDEDEPEQFHDEEEMVDMGRH